MSMPKGEYYVGDLCYVLGAQWDEVCSLVMGEHKCLQGEFTLVDGRKFAMYNTAYGDGVYKDQENRRYAVDSGSIGCTLVEGLDSVSDLGQVIDIPYNFECLNDHGVLCIGSAIINTKGDEDIDEDGDGDGDGDE